MIIQRLMNRLHKVIFDHRFAKPKHNISMHLLLQKSYFSRKSYGEFLGILKKVRRSKTSHLFVFSQRSDWIICLDFKNSHEQFFFCGNWFYFVSFSYWDGFCEDRLNAQDQKASLNASKTESRYLFLYEKVWQFHSFQIGSLDSKRQSKKMKKTT